LSAKSAGKSKTEFEKVREDPSLSFPAPRKMQDASTLFGLARMPVFDRKLTQTIRDICILALSKEK
jgi:hypothetical protein